jgi:uncharacterized protein YbcV (DUF1398 family)
MIVECILLVISGSSVEIISHIQLQRKENKKKKGNYFNFLSKLDRMGITDYIHYYKIEGLFI